MDSMESSMFPKMRRSRLALSLHPLRFTLHLAEGKPSGKDAKIIQIFLRDYK